MNDIRILECNRCFYKWSTRRESNPSVCPGCNSPYWDKSRVRKYIYKYSDRKKIKVI